jgi:hypothetical protein
VANIKHRSVKSLHRTHAKDTEAKHKKKENNMQLKNLWLNYENDDDETPTTQKENNMDHPALTRRERSHLLKQTYNTEHEDFEKLREHLLDTQTDDEMLRAWALGNSELTINQKALFTTIDNAIKDYRENYTGQDKKTETQIQNRKSVLTETQEEEPFDYLAMLDTASAKQAEPQPTTTKGEQHDATTKNRANRLSVK